jgi:hypothetical protein
MTIPVPNAEPSRKHIIGTPDILSARNIDSLCRGSGRCSVPNDDVVPQTEPSTQASQEADLRPESAYRIPKPVRPMGHLRHVLLSVRRND